MALGMEVGFGPSHIVLYGDPARFPPKGQFSVNYYCCQTAGCIKMSLGMEVSLNTGDFVLDGDPAYPPLKGHSPPIFVQCPL